MPERDHIIRIILEGRDKVSKSFDSATNSVVRFQRELDKISKRAKFGTDEVFPLFGGGVGTRDEIGRFTKQVNVFEVQIKRVEALANRLNRAKQLASIRKTEASLFEGEGFLGGGRRPSVVQRQDALGRIQTVRDLEAIEKIILRIRRSTGFNNVAEDLQKVTQRFEELEETFKKSGREFREGFKEGTSVGKGQQEEIQRALRDWQKLKEERLADIRKEEDVKKDEAREQALFEQRLNFTNLNKLKAIRRALRERELTENAKADIEAEVDKEIKNKKIRAENREAEIEERIAKEKALELAARQSIEDRRIRDLEKTIRQEIALRVRAVREQYRVLRFEERTLTRGKFIAERLFPTQEQENLAPAETFVGRVGQRVGRTFGEIGRGISAGRTNIKELSDEVRNSGNIFQRFGLNIGEATRGVTRFVNLRWLFITGIVSLFFQVIVLLGGALVALASSAIIASAALGGALVAGLAAALPAVGLLVAAFSRLGVVLDAVKLSEDTRKSKDQDEKDSLERRRQAVQRLADAQWTLKLALEGVGDAQFGLAESNKDLLEAYRRQKEAIAELAEARKRAAQDIVDANFEERSAALALEEAQLSLLQAKRRLREEEERKRASAVDVSDAEAQLKEANERLRIAREQGDQAEISGAAQAVSLAETSLNQIRASAKDINTDIKDAELSVERARLNQEQAVVRDKRSREEARRARSQGIEGSDQVKSAREELKNSTEGIADAQRQVVLSNRALRDSLHTVAIAQRELGDARRNTADATNLQTTAQKNLQEALDDLSPSEKKLFNALKRIQRVYRKVFVGEGKKDGILGAINESFVKVIDAITELLLDPKLQKAAKELANALGESISKFAEFIGSDNFKESLLFFIESATVNAPKAAEAILNIFKALLNIAQAATPLFDSLFDRFVGLTSRFERFTKPADAVRRPEEGGGGVADVGGQSGLEKSLGFADDHLDSWIKLGKAILNVLSALTVGAGPSGQGLAEKITETLNNWADFLRENEDSVNTFFEKLIKSFINLAKVLGPFSAALVEAFSSDEFVKFAELFLQVVVPGILAFVKVLGVLSGAILKLFDIPFVGDLAKWILTLFAMEKAFNKVFPITQKLTNLINKGFLKAIKGLSAVIFNPGGAIHAMRVFAGQIAQAFRNLVKLTIYMARTALANWKTFISTILASSRAMTVLKFAIRGVLAATAIGALILAAVLIIENWDKLKKWLGSFADWLKNNWKKAILLAFAILLPGGIILLGILKFRDKIKDVFVEIKNAIIDSFKEAFKWVREKVEELGNWLQKKLESLPLVGRFFKKNEATPEQERSTAESAIRDKSLDPFRKKIQRLRKAGLSPGDILAQLVSDGDITEGELKALLGKSFKEAAFGAAHGGQVPGSGKGDTVPAMLTPGEWILNAEQQKRLAGALHMGTQQVKAFLFGTKMDPKKQPLGPKPSDLPPELFSTGVTLIPQTDDDNNTVWFVRMANGAFGQVTARDAEKIRASAGRFIPGYVKRSSHGFTQLKPRPFAMGGVVSPAVIQKFAEGGLVQQPGFGGTQRGATVNQNFNVQTQGETDWGYVLRLGAINAQEAF